MTKINNPRFPHHCRILRYGATDPMEDQSNVLEYDPMADDPSSSDAGETKHADGAGVDTAVGVLPDGVTVIYDGECRSDNRDTISDNGDVITSYRTLSLPLKQDEWAEGAVPMEGDKIELSRIGYTEYGLVIDKRPSNLGTHLLWKYVRN